MHIKQLNSAASFSSPKKPGVVPGWSTNELTSSARLARILTSKRAAGLMNTSRASVLALFVPLFASLVLVKMFVYTL